MWWFGFGGFPCVTALILIEDSDDPIDRRFWKLLIYIQITDITITLNRRQRGCGQRLLRQLLVENSWLAIRAHDHVLRYLNLLFCPNFSLIHEVLKHAREIWLFLVLSFNFCLKLLSYCLCWTLSLVMDFRQNVRSILLCIGQCISTISGVVLISLSYHRCFCISVSVIRRGICLSKINGRVEEALLMSFPLCIRGCIHRENPDTLLYLLFFDSKGWKSRFGRWCSCGLLIVALLV